MVEKYLLPPGCSGHCFGGNKFQFGQCLVISIGAFKAFHSSANKRFCTILILAAENTPI